MAYRVYFGRLPDCLSQDDFEKMLEEHGKARNIEWKSGYAYVDYKHGSDASKTVQNLNGKEVGGNNILVELAQNGGGGYAVAGAFPSRPFAKPPPTRPIRTPHRVRIENLSSRAKWMELKELLSLAGEVTFADTHKRITGEGIVEFASRKDMDEAIKTFHNTTFFGKTIKLYDESPRGRSRSPGGKKSRSHSRHRSLERRRRSHSKSLSPRRKRPSLRHRSTSPRRRSNKRSSSRDQNKSRKRTSRSRTPRKSSRNSHKRSKKSKRNSSRSRSKSPRRKKHKRSRSSSRSSSDNNNDSKRKSKTKREKKHSSKSSSSDSLDSDNKLK